MKIVVSASSRNPICPWQVQLDQHVVSFRSEAEARAESLLASLGLGHRLTHRPSQLSGGEQQRVAVARALANRPLLVLADEPTGNLDRETADGVFELMLQLARDQGTAFIVVTHDETLAARCGRVMRLTAGVLT